MYNLVISGIDKNNKEITKATIKDVAHKTLVEEFLPNSKDMMVEAMIGQQRLKDAENIVRTLILIVPQQRAESVNI